MPLYVAMAGLHGCLPSYCEECESYQDAVECLVQLHELGRRRARELQQYGYVELRLRQDGNEYAEVVRQEVRA